mmetsp:Transcript_21962/g.37105  ORF Transcript_21962/g.37105 Transcript_21962/m.37105 type:complete len:219 (-) Transcript_21962:897-1553(-)
MQQVVHARGGGWLLSVFEAVQTHVVSDRASVLELLLPTARAHAVLVCVDVQHLRHLVDHVLGVSVLDDGDHALVVLGQLRLLVGAFDVGQQNLERVRLVVALAIHHGHHDLVAHLFRLKAQGSRGGHKVKRRGLAVWVVERLLAASERADVDRSVVHGNGASGALEPAHEDVRVPVRLLHRRVRFLILKPKQTRLVVVNDGHDGHALRPDFGWGGARV